ncbi:MAG: metalloregulator ArsR/SmtB family transcription factor [Mariprofundaceae bacterium]|nr:metalloregulator ArsR/SmtB family transcription factor [Mariprofundaceae bacterium]
MISQLSSSFKALGDPVRLRLFFLIGQHDAVCVCHLVSALDMPQSTISRHLGILRHAGLVQTRREGKWIYYALSGDVATQLKSVFNQVDAQLEADALALQTEISH